MVGPGEVDDELQPEVEEECQTKYGDVAKVIIFEVRGKRFIFCSVFQEVVFPEKQLVVPGCQAKLCSSKEINGYQCSRQEGCFTTK